MKTFGITTLLVGVMFTFLNIGSSIMANYKYEKQILCYWKLADKASTIPQKTEYIDKFVSALESSGLSGGYNALVLDTPNNSFDKNVEAVRSLQTRLHEIQGMDVMSFQYQTAIQQITAQEQGEAKKMLDVFDGVWTKNNYFWIWDWVGVIQVIFFITLVFVSPFIILES
jgi:hypothetical protein